MKSNSFILTDKEAGACAIVDPASEEADREINYIERNHLTLDYIIVTHAHADHCWGVNTLKEKYPEARVICCEDKFSKREIMLFFRMWHEDENYRFEMIPSDIVPKENDELEWHGHQMKFVMTPGHSCGSMCIDIDGLLFTGDTIMPFAPYFNGRGSNKEEWLKSIDKICAMYNDKTKIYPGHGGVVTLEEWKADKKWTDIRK